MSPDTIHLLFSLAVGFAFAGLLATGFQLATKQPLSFRLLESGPRPATFAVVPFLVFAAPFIIIRHIVNGRQIEGCSFQLVMVATVVAGVWSLMSGTVTIMALAAIARV